ncbi:metal transporter CNNM3 isoform X2 [Polypterus senegalus]|uniref:metal transporter CNNM3 isoform X2 n=1 Tax=Polypterus senegalus TaxID=55291 RepID=UPI001964ECBB|nr:metal transporter CNNM3 isoform X2 [Polypterus senegalus]
MVVSSAAVCLCLLAVYISASRLVCCTPLPVQVLGVRLENPGPVASLRTGVVLSDPNTTFTLRLYGSNLLNASWPWLAFASGSGDSGGGVPAESDPCHDAKLRSSATFHLESYVESGSRSDSALVHVRVTGADVAHVYHLCTRLEQEDKWKSFPGHNVLFVQQEPEPEPPPPHPLWLLALFVALLLLASAVFKSVHLSLLWLDPLELYVLRSCGSEKEKKCAKRLEPVRRRGNFLLCALLLLGALGHTALGVLFYRVLGSTVPAVFISGLMLFFVAELIPHILCSRYGFRLAPGITWLAQASMVFTCPLSCPLGLLLDLTLRRDVSTCYVREKIVDLMRSSDPYNEFVKEEFSRGSLRYKTVEDILTPLKECFMLSSVAVLDFGTMSEIMQSGYTRVPVYEDERTNIVDILYVKDLALVDPDDCTPLSTITKFYNHPLHFVFNDTKLDAMLEEFKKGKSHMAIVQKVNNEGEGDPFYEVLGLVTLEDVIEEIIRSEILDESDGYTESKIKKKPAPIDKPLEHRKDDFSLFKVPDGELKVKTSPQLLLATHRFLSREVDLFSPSKISEKILMHLLKHPSVNQETKFDTTNRQSADHYLYHRNHPVDYFILILQGRVEVEIGKEGLKFENGAFTYYGVSALSAPSSVHQSPVSTLRNSQKDQVDVEDGGQGTYYPDYTVRALTDLQYIKVSRLQYLNALMASRIRTCPDSIDTKIVPNSQTKLLNDRNLTAVFPVHSSTFDSIESYS